MSSTQTKKAPSVNSQKSTPKVQDPYAEYKAIFGKDVQFFEGKGSFDKLMSYVDTHYRPKNPTLHNIAIFAQDVNEKTGSKRYFFAPSYPTWPRVCPQIEKLRGTSFYEVILPTQLCYPFFDIDIDSKKEQQEETYDHYSQDYDFEKGIKNTIIKDFTSAITQVWKDTFNLDLGPGSIVVCDSSTDTKLSFHIIIHKIVNNIFEAKKVCKLTMKELCNQGHDLLSSCIDNKIYTKNRVFRLVGSCKLGKKNVKKIVSKHLPHETIVTNTDPLYPGQTRKNPSQETVLPPIQSEEEEKITQDYENITPVSELNPEDLTEFETAISDFTKIIHNTDYARGYDTWIRSVWALCNTFRGSENGKKIALELSKSAGQRLYDAQEFERVWQDTVHKLDAPGKKVTLGTLLHYVKEHDLEAYTSIRKKYSRVLQPKKKGLDSTTFLSSVPEYDPYAFSQKYKGKHFDTLREFEEKSILDLASFARLITGSGKPTIVLRVLNESGTEYTLRFIPYSEFRAENKNEICFIGEKNAPTSIFKTIDDPRLALRAVVCNAIPFNKPLKTLDGDVINIFPGYKAKLVDSVNMDYIDQVRELICHAHGATQGDEVEAKILDYVQHMLLHPNAPSEICPVVVGKQGTGKSFFYEEFLLKYVIGSKLSFTCNSIDDLLMHFNSHLEGIVLVVVSEATTENAWSAKMDKLKNMITSQNLPIYAKYKEAKKVQSGIHVAITTNHISSVKITDDNRRFLATCSSDEHRGDHKYWNKLASVVLTQECADHFATWLVNDWEVTTPLKQLPTTNMTRHMQEGSKTLEERYFDSDEYAALQWRKGTPSSNPTQYLGKKRIYDSFIDWMSRNEAVSAMQKVSYTKFIQKVTKVGSMGFLVPTPVGYKDYTDKESWGKSVRAGFYRPDPTSPYYRETPNPQDPDPEESY